MSRNVPDASHNQALTCEGFEIGRDGRISKNEIWARLEASGLRRDDIRLDPLRAILDAEPIDGVSPQTLANLVPKTRALIETATTGRLAISDFPDFSQRLAAIFERAKADRSGEQADYIPPLAEVDPEQFGLAVVSIDGQQLCQGDAEVDFSLQSAVKPFNYCFALEELGPTRVHRHVGTEPSGRPFHARVLLEDGSARPHNPMVNAGAIMCTALIHNDLPVHLRLQRLRQHWGRLTGGPLPRYNAWMAKEETRTGDNNRALGYMLKAAGVLPKGEHAVDHELRDALELYFSTCALEMTARELATAAATLANGGVCPTSGERVLGATTVRNCLAMMQMCGMYDASGDFCFRIGLPAKSGVGGAVILVVPGQMGICIWSPRLDAVGNSVRGVLVAEALCQVYCLHVYDRIDPNDRRPVLRKA